MKTLNTILLLLIGSVIYAHPLHLTISNVDIKDNELLVAIQLNSHQLELLTNTKVDEEHLHNFTLDSYMLPTINSYVKANFKLSSRKNPIELQFITYEVTATGVWLRYKGNIKDLKKLSLSNTLFTQDFSQQKNLVIIRHKEEEKGYEMDSNNTHQIIFPITQ